MERKLDDDALKRLLALSRDLVSDLDLDSVLGRVLAAAAEITAARYAAVGVLDETRSRLDSFVYRGIDESTRERIGDLPTGRGVLGVLIEHPEPLRLEDVSSHPESFGFPDGHPPMKTFLGVPVLVRGVPWGNLYLTEKDGGGPFDERDEAAAIVLSQWAGIAIANARSVAADRLRSAMEAAEQERLQWARELHDQSLQGLAAIRLTLAAGRRGDADALHAAAEQAIEQIDLEIASMRSLISDLRPDGLDELGIDAALEILGRRVEDRAGDVRVEVVADVAARADRLPRSLETAIYRVAQEAITNAIRHGDASSVRVELDRGEERAVSLRVRDDGSGFDPDSAELGFGIKGMRERAELAGGRLAIESAPERGTTLVTLELPLDGSGGAVAATG